MKRWLKWSRLLLLCAVIAPFAGGLGVGLAKYYGVTGALPCFLLGFLTGFVCMILIGGVVLAVLLKKSRQQKDSAG
jgi:uncharacterized BrkB/YihY/UPF0761 family membrane protein